MQIDDNKVVTIHYTLKNDDGQVLDSSQGKEPFSYLHGRKNIIQGLEDALTGKETGEQLNVSVEPKDGYGIRDEQLVQVIPRSAFQGIDKIEPGMQFQATSDKGVQNITVVNVEGDNITIDGNHALAGETLNFEVEIKDVRDATKEELEHGHVHGPGGHQH